MACEITYRPKPTIEDVLNQRRNEVLKKIEQELGMGLASVQVNPVTGEAKVVGASVAPEGMSDLCVLDALQTRGSVEFQLAATHAGVQNRNFAAAHAHAHAHSHKH
jgi:hypothetical protein